MFISKEEFLELVQEAISCLSTPNYNKYRLNDGTIVYDYKSAGFRKEKR